MTPPGIDAGAVAARCLAAIVDEHERQGWDLPERRYVAGGSPNEIAADTEHLAVTLSTVNPGASDASTRPGAIQSKGAAQTAIPRGDYVVRLMRCTPTGDEYGPPDAEVLHEHGLLMLADVGNVLRCLYRWRKAETGPGLNAQVTVGQVETIGPGGGLVGHLWFFTISPIQ